MASQQHVQRSTAQSVNDEIARRINLNILYYADHPDEIPRRMAELDREFDIERSLEATAASVVLIGLGLGAALDRRWLVLPGVVAGFLLQHSIQGWCPPLPLFRRMGVRTRDEINQERYGLKAVRGDFDEVSMEFDPNTRLGAVLAAVHE